MNIQQTHMAPIDVSLDALRERLTVWARQTGFRLVKESDSRWTFRRGSQWHAIYTFDLRKVPAVLDVEYLPISRSVSCSLRCFSWMQIATKNDRKRVEQELDSLLTCLTLPTGADVERLRAAEPWEPAPGPRDHYTSAPRPNPPSRESA